MIRKTIPLLISVYTAFFISLATAEEPPLDCAKSFDFFHISKIDKSVCSSENTKVKFIRFRTEMERTGLFFLNLHMISKSLSASNGLLFNEVKTVDSLYSIHGYQPDQVVTKGFWKEKYYLLDHTGTRHLIRCEKHKDKYACVTYIDTEQTYTTHVSTRDIFLGVYLDETHLTELPEHMNVIKDFLKKTDFSTFIYCDKPLYVCTGKPHKVNRIGQPIDKDGNVIKF